MRFWPARRGAVVAPLTVDDLALADDLVRRNAEDVLAIGPREVPGPTLAYRGRLRLPPARALDILTARLSPLGFTPFLRADGDEVVMQALPLAQAVAPARVGLNVVLFVLTCLSTLVAGA